MRKQDIRTACQHDLRNQTINGFLAPAPMSELY